MIPIINIDKEMRHEVWRIWRKRPKNLVSATISLRESGANFDFESWNTVQIAMLGQLLNKMSQGVVTIYDHEAIREIEKDGLGPLEKKASYDIIWSKWLPTIARQRSYLLTSRKHLQNLVESSAWEEYSGTFLLFGKEVDASLIARFVRQKWTVHDRFVAVTVFTNFPYWNIVTNYLSPNQFKEMLTGIVSVT